MNLIRRNVNSVAVLDVIGRLTSIDGAGLLKGAVDGLMLDGRLQVVLNLSKLTYMDSSGLGEMIACYSTMFKAGGAVKLANATERVHDLLTITKLITVFETFDTEREAIDSFTAPAAIVAPAISPAIAPVVVGPAAAVGTA